MNMLFSIAAAVTGALVFHHLRVPAGALIGAAVAVGALNLTSGLELPTPPGWVQFVAFAIIGWLIGHGLTRDILAELVARLPAFLVGVLALVMFGGLLAAVAVWFGILDPATAFLATSPGALSQMTALSAAVGADAAVVATLHTIRVLVVVLVSPVIIRLITSG